MNKSYTLLFKHLWSLYNLHFWLHCQTLVFWTRRPVQKGRYYIVYTPVRSVYNCALHETTAGSVFGTDFVNDQPWGMPSNGKSSFCATTILWYILCLNNCCFFAIFRYNFHQFFAVANFVLDCLSILIFMCVTSIILIFVC